MVEVFQEFFRATDPATVHLRCVCGSRYVAAQSRACPACGRRVPRSVSIGGKRWVTYAQMKSEALRRVLEASPFKQMPEDQRAAARLNLEEQIRQLEDGSWKIAARRRIDRLREMLEMKGPSARFIAGLGEKEVAEMKKMCELGIQTAQQELEAAGETP